MEVSMDTESFVMSLQSSLAGQVPSVIGAVLLFLLGWMVALVAAAAARRLLGAMGFNTRFETLIGQRIDAETGISRIVFWFILIIALIAGFNMLDLEVVSAPFANMVNKVLSFLPQLLAGAVLATVGWILAVLARTGITRLLAKTTLDERLSAQANMEPVSGNIGQVAYWVVLLLFLPMVLAALGLEGLLGPVQGMLTQLLAFLPNLFGAAVIGVVGYFVARIVRGIVVNLMEATRVQAAAQGLGVSDKMDLAKLGGTIVFLLIFIPALIAALDALKIEAISGPATRLLDQIVAAVPNLLAAALILIITYYVARFAASLVASLLSGLGADSVPEKIGMAGMFGGVKLSDVIARLVMFFAMLFATVEAASRLEFSQVSSLVSTFIEFGGDVLLGAVILLIGFWLAKLLSDAVSRGDQTGSAWLGGLVRALILGLVIAMGLRAMGIADSIVNLAFGLTLGAVAVAVALSFGLGGREAAGRLMEHWLSKLRKD
jgi:hypothetical protein